MCGIYANFGIDIKKSIDADLIYKLNRRGPDNFDQFSDPHCHLAHSRLSIIDLSSTADQPMFNEDKNLIIIFNGEIYNYLELRAELQLVHEIDFRTRSDTEVILKGYELLGADFFKRLDGMFAFIIYNKKDSKLIACRDRFGIKPLFIWGLTKDSVQMSSVAPFSDLFKKMPDQLDWQSITDFLFRRLVMHSEHTFHKKIFKIPPGEVREYSLENSEIKYQTLFRISLRNPKVSTVQAPANIKSSALNKTERLIYSEVVKSAISDVPFATLISGGVDSTLINLILHHAGYDFEAFHLKPSTETPESANVERVSKIIGLNVNYIPEQETNSALLENQTYAHGLPANDLSVVNHFYLMSQVKRHNFKVVMSGSGGDELFAGYPHHLLPLQRTTNSVYLKNYFSISFLKSLLNRKTKEYLLLGMKKNKIAKYQYLNIPNFRNQIRIFGNKEQTALANSLTEDIMEFTLPGFLNYEDANSMHHSIELRPPLLSNAVMSYLLTNIDQDKSSQIYTQIPKSTLISLGSKLLGDDLVKGVKKFPFPGSIREFLIREKMYFHKLIIKVSNQNEMLKKDNIIRDLDFVTSENFLNTHSIDLSILWRTLAFCVWYNLYINRFSHA